MVRKRRDCPISRKQISKYFYSENVLNLHLMAALRWRYRNSSEDKADKLPVPPGFILLTSFKVKKLRNGEESFSSSTFQNESAQMNILSNAMDPAKFKNYLRYRPWILQDQVNNIVEESVSKRLDKVKKN